MRNAVAHQTPLGRQAEEYIKAGALVPDSLIVNLVGERLQERDCEKGFVLDGFPRTIAQAQSLEGILKERALALDCVLAIRVARDTIIQRLAGRRTCKACGTLFHLIFDPPKKADRCDKCGGTLFQREDDCEETIAARLNVYDRQTSPLIAFYRDRGILKEIEGVGTVAQVGDQILRVLGDCTA